MMRKSNTRMDERPSYLPKPRVAGSSDRLSVEMRRPSNARSSSAEPPRGSVTGARLSREQASATKIPLHRRSRSQQNEQRYGQPPVTPLRSSYYARPTITPQRTPSSDRNSRNWQSSLERVLAFCTMRDLRPISTAAWQRAEFQRVQEGLSARGGDAGGAGLMRPLTITGFVDIAGSLLSALIHDHKLNNDNYVAKIPHIAKILLYPGTVSKSWLKGVNTLHAFPHALAFMSYLLDLANVAERPVAEELLYVDNDEIAVCRREYLYKCWFRFQEPGPQFDDLDEEYIHNLKQLLGNDEAEIASLTEENKRIECSLNDEADIAARADEARREERRTTVLSAVKAERAGRIATNASIQSGQASAKDSAELLRALEADIEKANAESQQIRRELEEQRMSVAERTKLMDQLDYATRVTESKQALAQQISKLVFAKETELVLWQRRALASCMEYNQRLIENGAACPDIARFAVDEKELMEERCVEQTRLAVDAIRESLTRLSGGAAEAERNRQTHRRQRTQQLEDLRTAISQNKASLQRELETLASEQSREQTDANQFAEEESEIAREMEKLRVRQEEYNKSTKEMHFWTGQERTWKSRISELDKFVSDKRYESDQLYARAKQSRADVVMKMVNSCVKTLE